MAHFGVLSASSKVLLALTISFECRDLFATTTRPGCPPWTFPLLVSQRFQEFRRSTSFGAERNIACKAGVALIPQQTMQIRFISGLTAEEENELAPALLSAVTTLLDRFPLAYTLRIETSGNRVFQHSLPARPQPDVMAHSRTAAHVEFP